MTITTGAATVCRPGAGDKHVHVPITVGGQNRTIAVSISEFVAAAPDSPDEARELIVQRFRSAILEGGDLTAAGIAASIGNKTFKV